MEPTTFAICHNVRIVRHRVFRMDARQGKNSVGWFYGFKLHLVISDRGYISAALTERLFTTRSLVLIIKLRKSMHERVLAATNKLFASARSSRASTTNSITSLRSSTLAIAARTISSFTPFAG